MSNPKKQTETAAEIRKNKIIEDLKTKNIKIIELLHEAYVSLKVFNPEAHIIQEMKKVLQENRKI